MGGRQNPEPLYRREARPRAAGRVQGSPALHACLQAEQRRRSGLGTLYLFFLGEICHGDLQSGGREVVVWAQGSLELAGGETLGG